MQVDLLLQTRRSVCIVEIKRQREIGREIVDEVAEKVRRVPVRKGMSVRTALVYEGSLAPVVCLDTDTNTCERCDTCATVDMWSGLYKAMTDYLSGAVAGRFIYSNLTQGVTDGSSVGWSVAADVAVYYKRPVEWFRDMNADIAWGVCINNIGSKISYNYESIDKDFIPTTLRFGPSLKLDLDDYNSLTFMVDVTKLLVPTPPLYKRDEHNAFVIEDGELVIEEGMSDNVSVMSGIFQSFYDAPGYSYNEYGEKVGLGKFYEELCEYNVGVGVEYWYNNVFGVRGGYFNETALKGNRKYVTLGAALKYNVLGIDVSYLIPVNGTVGTNPLENTLRFNLTYNMGSSK